MPDEIVLTDTLRTWADLTATELYTDFCNSGHAQDVLRRALAVGYGRGRTDERAVWRPPVDLEASVAAAAQAVSAGTVRMVKARR